LGVTQDPEPVYSCFVVGGMSALKLIKKHFIFSYQKRQNAIESRKGRAVESNPRTLQNN